MKRFLTFALALALLLTACGGREAGEAVDYNQYLCCNTHSIGNEAYYIEKNQQLYFWDRELTSGLSLLCARADCDHSEESGCTAWLPIDGTVWTWNGGLYYVTCSIEDGSMELYRMEADGSGRSRVAKLKVAESNGCAWSVRLVSGYLCINYEYSTAQRDVTTLYLFSMEDPAGEPMVLFTNEDMEVAPDADWREIPRSYAAYVTEDWVFYSVSQTVDGVTHSPLYGYRVSTGETLVIMEDGYTPLDDLSRIGDTLYWYDYDGSFKSVDLNTGAHTHLWDHTLGENMYSAIDDRWFYCSGGTSVDTAETVIYDLEGNVVQRLSCTELNHPVWYAFSDEEHIFFRPATNSDTTPTYYVRRTDVEKGRAEFIPLSVPGRGIAP